MTDQVDSTFVDRVVQLRILDQSAQDGRVVDRAPEEIAARIGRIPEAGAGGIGRSIGMQVQEAVLVRERLKLHVGLLHRPA